MKKIVLFLCFGASVYAMDQKLSRSYSAGPSKNPPLSNNNNESDSKKSPISQTLSMPNLLAKNSKEVRFKVSNVKRSKLPRSQRYLVLPGFKVPDDTNDNHEATPKPTIPLSLPMPNLSVKNLKGVRAGLYPDREGSIRIEIERYMNKYFVHNYGHGCAGVSLANGSAAEAGRLVQEIYAKEPLLKESPIAIIGGGVIGLTQAFYLLLKGCDVNLYMEDKTPFTTSDRASGAWGIFKVSRGKTYEEEELFKRVAHDSLRSCEKLADGTDKSLDGFKWAKSCRILNNEKERLTLEGYEYLGRSVRNLAYGTMNFNGVAKSVAYYESILIDIDRLMASLFEQVESMGGIIVRREFKSLTEIQEKLSEPIIFNCTGLGSVDLFPDPHLKPIWAQMLVFKQDANNPIDYRITQFLPKDPFLSFVTLIPAKELFFVGTAFKEGEEKCEVDDLLAKILLFAMKDALNIKTLSQTASKSF